jgi:nucleotide-binding universal stress UspA family protein
MFNKILVPLDGSALAERALAPAVNLAERDDAELVLLRVLVLEKMLVPDTHVPGGYNLLWPDQSLTEARTAAEHYLRDQRRGCVSADVRAQLQVVEGGVAETIVDVAADRQADLIVMSSHGYSGVTRWMLGSIAERVLHSAACPVLVMRSPRPLQHVLIPLDGSDLSERALEPALSLAAGLEARVTLLRAVPIVSRAEKDRLDALERGLGDRLESEMHQQAETYLHTMLANYPTPGVTAQTAVVFEPAAEAILHYAETHAVDLIAMSTHGHTGLRRWVYGSVTEKVLHSTPHSMLVIRPRTQHLN